MRVPSRLMPQVTKRRPGSLGYAVLTVMVVGLLYLIWQYPVWVGAGILAMVLGGFVEIRRHRQRMRTLAAQRPVQGGICDFAREFDIRETDSWVVRAVYEELEAYFRSLGVTLAIRADDDLVSDLGVDPEDLDMGIASDIATRTGRSLKDSKRNPYYKKVRTARDLVLFFNSQPKDRAT